MDAHSTSDWAALGSQLAQWPEYSWLNPLFPFVCFTLLYLSMLGSLSLWFYLSTDFLIALSHDCSNFLRNWMAIGAGAAADRGYSMNTTWAWLVSSVGCIAPSQQCSNESCVVWVSKSWSEMKVEEEWRHGSMSLCHVLQTYRRPQQVWHLVLLAWDLVMVLNSIMASRDCEMKAKAETVRIINTILVELLKQELFKLFLLLRNMKVWQMIRWLQQTALSIVIQIGHLIVKENSVVFQDST